MAKRFLNELRWHPEKSLYGVTSSTSIGGRPVTSRRFPPRTWFLKNLFFMIENHRETMVPYHRIKEINRGSEILWKKM